MAKKKLRPIDICTECQSELIRHETETTLKVVCPKCQVVKYDGVKHGTQHG